MKSFAVVPALWALVGTLSTSWAAPNSYTADPKLVSTEALGRNWSVSQTYTTALPLRFQKDLYRVSYCYSTENEPGHWVKDPMGRDHCCALSTVVAAVRKQAGAKKGFSPFCCGAGEFWDGAGGCWYPVMPPKLPDIRDLVDPPFRR